MSKKWEEIGSNALVGAPKHSLAEFKEHLKVQRMKPEKSIKEEKETENGVKAKKKRSKAKTGN